MKYFFLFFSLFFAFSLNADISKKEAIKEITMYRDMLDRNIAEWEKGGGDVHDCAFFYLVGMRNGLDVAQAVLLQEKKMHPH